MRAILAALILAPPAQAQTPGWTLEKHPKELRLKRASRAPVRWSGNDRMSPEIILSCDLATKRLSAFVGAEIKIDDWMTRQSPRPRPGRPGSARGRSARAPRRPTTDPSWS